ncbi:hypothetical protein AX774_g614 [Zancudomyces culisetae]|uniref:Uncharacterized protein n=1 Tax=Zancudomyces culisetae TaxID=1213189 RepID=A0A1R1PY41_ZANCU|nr:hypothetical protein AX774_g6619 [Zancudomyces culisetae]OMH85838.1 hypothetical protein AX774_g614 [Zancudomyces culisetae]|eukprot:OMH79950.1 hypothetical protein AX774_g6619 [Zancudomyces culisetae]
MIVKTVTITIVALLSVFAFSASLPLSNNNKNGNSEINPDISNQKTHKTTYSYIEKKLNKHIPNHELHTSGNNQPDTKRLKNKFQGANRHNLKQIIDDSDLDVSDLPELPGVGFKQPVELPQPPGAGITGSKKDLMVPPP